MYYMMSYILFSIYILCTKQLQEWKSNGLKGERYKRHILQLTSSKVYFNLTQSTKHWYPNRAWCNKNFFTQNFSNRLFWI